MILLTGASGFIGRHLISALITEYGMDSILALTSAPVKDANYLLHNNYDFDVDYFVKSGYGEQIETIIHAGAFTPKNSKQANDWKACNRNVFTTDRLLQTTLPKLKKLIYLSTLDVYQQSDLISESSLTQPSSFYGESKLYSEKIATAWAIANNKAHQILRVGHVYGPGEEAYEKIIPVSITKILQDQPLHIWGTGNEIRSFIFIRDIVDAILNAVKLKDNIGIVNLAGSQKITITELVNKLIAISGKNSLIEKKSVDTPGKNFVFDNSKMKQWLLANETTLDEGLAEEWAYMKRYSNENNF